ncbi:heterokaryon incompatibility protein-domain-containing protein [Podospora didyma]|uniref:Heterokaryon incompatibility protein-domain-containing protein n=1 Tax=Podospora didyma TaxID=330526 RepID=A0AAE0NQD4_9PEZI|nr:heterokaryon incompatibility protein-domain-containing protein [Podospora didyma]
MATQSGTYTYQKLPSEQSFRLLHVRKGRWDDPIVCDLSISSLPPKNVQQTPEPLLTRWLTRLIRLVRPLPQPRAPEYRALSYVWGDPDVKTSVITVDGFVFPVTPNLFQALRRLRGHAAAPAGDNTDTLTVWVDAICINQGDEAELTQQLAIMGRIYKLCTAVCVWLGPCGCENVPGCVDVTTLSDDTPPRDDDTDIARCARYLVGFAAGKHLADITTPTAHGRSYVDLQSAMMRAANSDWFTRGWVVQEALLPNYALVYFGNVMLSREFLWEAYSVRRRHADTLCACCHADEPASVMQAMNKLFKNLLGLAVVREPRPEGLQGGRQVATKPKMWLLLVQALNKFFSHLLTLVVVPKPQPEGLQSPSMQLLRFTVSKRGQVCTKAKDRIYAYRGYVEEWLQTEVPLPAYNDPITVPDLFVRVCANAVLNDRTMQFLCWDTSKRDFDGSLLPSWSLDWTYSPPHGDDEWVFASERWNSANGIPFKAAVLHEHNHNILVGNGLQIDKVLHVGQVFHNDIGGGIFNKSLFQKWHNKAGLFTSPDLAYPAGGTRGAAWWRALCFDSKFLAEPKRWTDAEFFAKLEFTIRMAPAQQDSLCFLPGKEISDAAEPIYMAYIALPGREAKEQQLKQMIIDIVILASRGRGSERATRYCLCPDARPPSSYVTAGYRSGNYMRVMAHWKEKVWLVRPCINCFGDNNYNNIQSSPA